MSSWRVRNEGTLLVLQVYVPPAADGYGYRYEKQGTWRDATVEDIPTIDPFERPTTDRIWAGIRQHPRAGAEDL